MNHYYSIKTTTINTPAKFYYELWGDGKFIERSKLYKHEYECVWDASTRAAELNGDERKQEVSAPRNSNM